MAAGFKHETFSDPVVFFHEVKPALHHGISFKIGPPPATRRTGQPQVWESMQKMFCSYGFWF
jgi:hypothetical protein